METRLITLYSLSLSTAYHSHDKEIVVRWVRARNGLKSQQGTFRLAVTKNIFTKRTVMPCNRMPRKVVESPSLEVFRKVWIWHKRMMFNDEHDGGVKSFPT